MNTRKSSEICSKSTIKRVESHPSVFIVNFIVDFEYLNVFRGALSCVKTIKSKDAVFNIIQNSHRFSR